MSVLAPLLRPAAWHIAPGAADVPWLRRLGGLLILASVLALLSWCAAIAFDAWRLRRVASVTWLALPVFGLCAHLAWRMATSWRQLAPAMTLRWLGPIDHGNPRAAAGGWRVDEWGTQPVDVTLVWDWQRLLLLRVRATRGSAASVAWVWLQDDPSRPERQVHRLRTLLCLPPERLVPELVASSAHDPHAAAPVSMTGGPPAQAPHRARHRIAPQGFTDCDLGAPLRLEDDFPATQLLDRWDDAELRMPAEKSLEHGGQG
jgi:hypothetical protein